MLRKQINRCHIERAFKSVNQMISETMRGSSHLVNLHINSANKEAVLKISHAIKGDVYLSKWSKGWLLEYLNNTPVECTSLVHVKKCLTQIFSA